MRVRPFVLHSMYSPLCFNNMLYVNTWVSIHLFLGNDDLCWQGVLSVGNGMCHQTDSSHNLLKERNENQEIYRNRITQKHVPILFIYTIDFISHLKRRLIIYKHHQSYLSFLFNQIRNIGWVTDNHFTPSRFFSGFDTHNLAILIHQLISGFVQHIGSTVDRTQPGKALRQLTKTIEWVEIRRFAVTSEWITVQLDLFYGRNAALCLVIIVSVKGQSVSSKASCVLVKPKFSINL